MSRKFRDNRLETCSGEQTLSKAEYKDAIKKAKKRVSRINGHLDALADMSTTYDYNQDAVVSMIGQATVNLSLAKEEVKRMKGRKYGK